MNSIEILFQKPVFHALGWALLHFVWQGALVASLFSIFSALARKRSANLRYAAACSALLLLLIAPIVTFFILYTSAGPVAAAGSVAPTPDCKTPIVAGSQTSAIAGDNHAPLLSQPPVVCEQQSKTPSAGIVDQSRLSGIVRDKFNSVAPWLVSLWFIGVIALSIRFIGGLAFTRKLKSERNNPAGAVWQQKAVALCARLRVSRPVLLCESALVEVPTVIGWLRPAILVPASALSGLAPDQLEALLAHELAHIRRYDYLVNLAQTAVETLLFYHPAVWWISAQIRIERENCCDDIAVATCGDVLTYARALADLEQIRGASPRLALAASGGSLLTRIERLVGRTRPGRRHHMAPQLAGLLSVSVVFTFLLSASGAFPPAVALGAIESKLASAAATSSIARFLGTESKSNSSTAARQSDNKRPDPNAEASARKDAESAATEREQDNTPPAALELDSQDRDRGRNQPASDYIDQMAAAGYKNLSIDQLIELKMQGVTPDYIRGMRDAGYDKLAVHELIAMKIQGVTPQYVHAMAEAGYTHLSVEELVGMRSQGVSPDYVRDLKSGGFDNLSPRAVIAMRIQNVTPDYIKAMREAGFDKLSPNELIALRVQNVDAAYVKRMRDAGLENLSAHELAAFRSQNIDPGYIKEMRDAGLEKLSPHQLLALRSQDVTADYIRQMKAAGMTELSIERLAGLKSQGITPEFIQQMKALGFADLSASDLIGMKVQGIDGAYIKQMRDLVSKDLSVHALIGLKVQGVDAEFIEGMKRVGYSNLSGQQLVSLKVQGVTPEYIQELKSAGYSGLSVREIIEAKVQGITPEFIKKIKDHGFKDLTIRQLIRLKMAGLPDLTGAARDARPAPAPRAVVTVTPDLVVEPVPAPSVHVEVKVVCTAEPAPAPISEHRAAPAAAPAIEAAPDAPSVEVPPAGWAEVDARCKEKAVGVWRYLKTETVKSFRRVDQKNTVVRKLVFPAS